MTFIFYFKKEDSLSLFENLKTYGEVHKTENALVFFGNDNFSQEEAIKIFSTSCWLKQVHGHKVISATSTKEEADGHYTTKKQTPLFIKTADCMPVFFETENEICALHIGWRGLAQKILTHSLTVIKGHKVTSLWVGPHIQQYRFSLDENSVLELFKYHKISISEAQKLGILQTSYEQKFHYWVDLKSLLFREAYGLGIQNFYFSDTDTYRSFKHYSHRRHPYRNGNNLSFIMKIS